MAMAMNNKVVFLVWAVMMMSSFGASMGAEYRVGDSAGWTTDSPVDYARWASAKTFRVGDTIRFEYNKEYHDVVRVTHLQYRACNTTMPLATFSSGNDTFVLRRPTHLFFLCSVPGHCEAGQKVDIRVPHPSTPTTSSNPKIPTQLSTPPDSPFPAPAPQPAAPENRASGLRVYGISLAIGAVSSFMVLFW